jgi:hypothetical protein
LKALRSSIFHSQNNVARLFSEVILVVYYLGLLPRRGRLPLTALTAVPCFRAVLRPVPAGARDRALAGGLLLLLHVVPILRALLWRRRPVLPRALVLVRVAAPLNGGRAAPPKRKHTRGKECQDRLRGSTAQRGVDGLRASS